MGIPGDLSLGITFPGDMSLGKSRTEKVEWDTFPGDNAGPTYFSQTIKCHGG
nr:hypothetical protein [Tanacetum cinerariifolium]